MESFDSLAWLVRLNKRGRQSPGPRDCGEARRGLGSEQERGNLPRPGVEMLLCTQAARDGGSLPPAPVITAEVRLGRGAVGVRANH